MKPVCFMVMPFGVKPVTLAAEGAPKSVNCDHLWDRIFRPTLERLGYVAVRADLESTSVIIKDMLNRLKHADLVVADVSLPNGNVYYELGVRHVARENRCVQVAADWFRPLFDVQQLRTITYALKNGDVPESEAAVIRPLLQAKIERYQSAATPYYELVDDTPEEAFAEDARRLAEFQAELSEVRLMPAAERASRVGDVVGRHAAAARLVPSIALELLYLVRDANHWQAVREFVESLPELTRDIETVQEQYFLALSELGEHEKAIAGIGQLVRRFGATPERCGLIGGRFKRLYREVRKEREERGDASVGAQERKHLNQAIESYDRGMQLDLNEYYCSCNLPTLLRARRREGDEERAETIESQVLAACRRAQHLGSTDPWLNATLFGTAFRQGRAAALEDIADEIEVGVPWQLGSTLDDAADWIEQAPPDTRPRLEDVLARLRASL